LGGSSPRGGVESPRRIFADALLSIFSKGVSFFGRSWLHSRLQLPDRERPAEALRESGARFRHFPALGELEVEMAAQKPKRGPVMRTETKMSEDRRQKMLREMLTRLRDETFERVSDFRRDQRDAVTQQGDEMDVARSSSDAETKANLIERAEERLRYIDQALGRLERGNYGTCAECGESIPIERLMAVPFAIYCVDCQQKRHQPRFRGEGRMMPVDEQPWAAADEAAAEPVRRPKAADDDESPLSDLSPFGPEEGEAVEPPSAPRRRRGRPRKG
jgi:DnaK suppressor protein